MPDSKEQMSKKVNRNDADILRMTDVIPPFDKKASSKSDSHTPAAAEKCPDSIPVEEVKSKKINIPRFDLSEHITAEYRRASAAKRRKAVAKKSDSQNTQARPDLIGSDNQINQQHQSAPFKHNELIAQIVTRDIARFCKNN